MKIKPIDCEICEEIASNRPPGYLTKYVGDESRIVMQSELFVCMPTVSPILKGHVMVFPRKHIGAFSLLPGDAIASFRGFVSELVDQMSSFGGTLAFFEHGAVCDDGYT